MKNKQAIVDFVKEEIRFKFLNEEFVMNLKEGDKEDNWNSFVTKDEVVRDLNFCIFPDEGEMFFTAYELIANGDGTWSTDTSSDTKIKIIEVIGSVGSYLDIPFDGVKTSHFELFDDNGVMQLKTKKFNKACDLSIINKWKHYCIDIYGNRKLLNP